MLSSFESAGTSKSGEALKETLPLESILNNDESSPVSEYARVSPSSSDAVIVVSTSIFIFIQKLISPAIAFQTRGSLTSEIFTVIVVEAAIKTICYRSCKRIIIFNFKIRIRFKS